MLELLIAKFLEPHSGFYRTASRELVLSSGIVQQRARAIVEQGDNFLHRQRMSFSLGADALSYDARQVAARLDVVRESYDRREL
jgi:hypothetical protein